MKTGLQPRHRVRLASITVLSVLAGCNKTGPEATADGAVRASADGGAEVVAIGVPDAGTNASAASLLLHALALITPVMNEPEWPPRDPTKASDERKSAVRLGYLRKGDTVAVRPRLEKKANCPEGWYELLPLPGAPPGSTGGFVCGKQATLDAGDKDLATAPHPPNMNGPLPYDYGLNLVNGAPLYRRAPRAWERIKYEHGLAVGGAPRKAHNDDEARGGEAAGSEESASGAEDPAWRLAHKDKSQLSLDDLRGETGLIELRMIKGFYLGLDKDVRMPPAGWFWKTTHDMFVPKEFILVHDPKVEFQGVRLDATGETRHLPLGWITNPHQWKYRIVDLDDRSSAAVADKGAHQKVRRLDHVDRFTIVQLTGKKDLIDEREYWETAEGWWMRAMDGTTTNPASPPKDLAPGERWIDVNLGKQSLVAFEGTKPVFATIISSGRHNDDDPAKDHRTRPGEFRIREKHVSATMDNDTATDGPYSIEDVPWIMYFDGSTALHGAFWHSRFGHERSHGCVNMTPHDAHELFGWIGPQLPEGWHGVRATDANPGTRVMVHYDGKTAAESKAMDVESRDGRQTSVEKAPPPAN